jgi:hypothetical protein
MSVGTVDGLALVVEVVAVMEPVEVEVVLLDVTVGLVAVVDLLPQPAANSDSADRAITIVRILWLVMP